MPTTDDEYVPVHNINHFIASISHFIPVLMELIYCISKCIRYKNRSRYQHGSLVDYFPAMTGEGLGLGEGLGTAGESLRTGEGLGEGEGLGL